MHSFFAGLRQRYTRKLISPHNLEPLLRSSYAWRAQNGDPQFLVSHSSGLANCWVRLKLRIHTSSLAPSPLVVYQDTGDGFSENTAHYLFADKKGNIDFSWKTPVDLKNIRIDPVAQILDFSISNFSIKSVPSVYLAVRSVATVFAKYPGGTRQKILAALRLVKARGLKVTFSKVVSASNALAHNPAIALENSLETLALQRLAQPDRLATLEQYVQNGFERSYSKVAWQSQYVPKAPDAVQLDNLPVKLIAFYLPQFHPFPQNDGWWGKGFTEWTNVSKAQPQFVDHYQPRLPGELGYYDLRLPEVMRQQIDLAHHYGVTGFCFHHYWFGGTRLMERPVNQFLAEPSLNMDFCLCWANENWTRRWDGADSDVLIAQNHSIEDDAAFFNDILPALKDSRYIKVDGKPFLIVYRASLLPNPKATGALWRKMAIDAGLPGLYLVAAKAQDVVNPQKFGFDAAVEFPPHQIHPQDITHTKTFVNPDFDGKVYDYSAMVKNMIYSKNDSYTIYKTVMPSWDNEARKPGKGYIFDGADPAIYAKWLNLAVDATLNNKKDEQLVFVNAWNEWAEGAHLEPDRHYGYAYLHATAAVLRNKRQLVATKAQIEESNLLFNRMHDGVIILHLYYEDLIQSIFEDYLTTLQFQCDLIVTLRPDASTEAVLQIKRRFPNVYFLITENWGRDIRPFFQALALSKDLGYQYFGKIHSKKSLHREDGDVWRDSLFSSLVGSEAQVSAILKSFEINPQLGLIVPPNSMVDLSVRDINLGNRYWLNILLKRLNSPEYSKKFDFKFPAGSMYWGRTDAFLCFLEKSFIDLNDFELEAGQLDGTLAHAVERLVLFVVQKAGFTVANATTD